MLLIRDSCRCCLIMSSAVMLQGLRVVDLKDTLWFGIIKWVFLVRVLFVCVAV
jgi:hypothetical protein